MLIFHVSIYINHIFHRFNDRAFAVDATNPPFPRSTAYWWFGCKSAPSGTIGTSESRGWLVGEESSSRSPWDDMINDMDTGRKSNPSYAIT